MFPAPRISPVRRSGPRRFDPHLLTDGRPSGRDLESSRRRHAEFYREGARFTVRDVGSLNGTYVNREPVDQAVLANGDEVQIGKFRLVFLTGSNA